MTPRAHLAFAAAATLVVGATIAWGFVLAGSPATRREARFDEQRLEDLQRIAEEIQFLVNRDDDEQTLEKPLPKTLAEAAKLATGSKLNLTDPENGKEYGYKVLNQTTYELCATFSQKRDWDTAVFWNHPAGAHCFRIDVTDSPFGRAP